MPCRHRIENPDPISTFRFFCAAAKGPIDGEILPRIKSEMEKDRAYLSCRNCILYDKQPERRTK